MLMVVKNQIRVFILSIKYALMREMLNKVTFITNILFMILNNASFIKLYSGVFEMFKTMNSSRDILKFVEKFSARDFDINDFEFDNETNPTFIENDGTLVK